MVSEISLGSWLTYGGGVERERAEACVAKAFEVGIDFIDTANVYSRGAAEEFLGEVLADRPRDSYVLATKLYWPMPDGGRGLSREQVLTQIDASLRRLRTDYVDLYQCHRYDWNMPLEETMEALTEVVRQGKARYLGFSEWPEEKIREAQAMAGVEHFVSSQPQYSMLWRGPERDVIPASRELGISQIVWSPLAQGVLTGKYKPGEPLPDGTRATSDVDGRLHGPRARSAAARARAAAAPARRRARTVDGPARARLGAAGGERRRGDHRRQPARAGLRQRRRLRRRARCRDAADRSTRSSATASAGTGLPASSRRSAPRGPSPRARTRRLPRARGSDRGRCPESPARRHGRSGGRSPPRSGA